MRVPGLPSIDAPHLVNYGFSDLRRAGFGPLASAAVILPMAVSLRTFFGPGANAGLQGALGAALLSGTTEVATPGPVDGAGEGI